MTSHEQQHLPLVDYVNESLDPAERSAFETHLSECAACREELAMLRTVKQGVDRHGESYFSDHPGVDELVAAVRGETTGDEARLVLEHVEICATCKAESRWILDGADSPVAALPERPAERGFDFARWGGWITAAAASLLLVFSFSGWMQGPSTGADGVPQSFIVQPSVRGDDAVHELTVLADTTSISLLVEVNLPRSAFPATVELQNDQGEILFSDRTVEFEELAGELHAIVPCSTSDCVPGDYVVVVTGSDGTGQVTRSRIRLVAGE